MNRRELLKTGFVSAAAALAMPLSLLAKEDVELPAVDWTPGSISKDWTCKVTIDDSWNPKNINAGGNCGVEVFLDICSDPGFYAVVGERDLLDAWQYAMFSLQNKLAADAGDQFIHSAIACERDDFDTPMHWRDNELARTLYKERYPYALHHLVRGDVNNLESCTAYYDLADGDLERRSWILKGNSPRTFVMLPPNSGVMSLSQSYNCSCDPRFKKIIYLTHKQVHPTCVCFSFVVAE